MPAAVEFRSISKSFGGVTALRDVSLMIEASRVHALVGENGAGKSTLGKILAGIHRPDSGRLLLDGHVRAFRGPHDAARAGIGMVHQELAGCPDLSIAENLALGRYPRGALGWIDRPRMHRQAERALDQIGVQLDVRAMMSSLSTAQEQLVQIAAAVAAGGRIIVFDEPTSSLSEADAQRLLERIDQLRAAGITIVYVSHRMPEIFRLADRISVLRDGRHIETLRRDQTSPAELVKLMIGREFSSFLPARRDAAPGPPRLEIERLSSPKRFADISLTVRAGEIVGLAGLVGAGRSEIAAAVFGLDASARGTVRVDGTPLRLGAPRAALRAGIGFVPEDRKRQGLILPMSVRANFSLVILDRLRRFGLLSRRRERQAAREALERLDVRTPTLETPAQNLSGGNQQKLVIAKWLARDLRVLIVDEPTRGVDVAAKAAIHQLLVDLAAQGLAILLISSELPELIGLADRLLVLRDGRLVDELPGLGRARDPDAEASHSARVMASMSGAR